MYLWRTEEGVEFSWTGVTDCCKLSCEGWELNLGPLEEQLLLLATEKNSLSTATVNRENQPLFSGDSDRKVLDSFCIP